MGNIVGEGFNKNIRDQVERRQKTHGSGYNGKTLRTNEELVVLNNNTAWVKLMSSVSIDDPTAINNPTITKFAKKKDALAKSFVLFNGTSEFTSATKNTAGNTINSFTTQREGVDFTNTLEGQNSVYGIGGSADFGLNPMMGITGIDVKHKNRGSIRTATVTVKAFNRAQFEIIDVLYMRLGFSVLLEWGNSMYINNKNIYISDGGQENSLTSDWFIGNDYRVFLEKIRKQVLSSHGNYDAMLAKVSNYHWSFQKDGSYDITIDLVSMGDVIESLNAGKAPNGIDTNATKGETSPLGIRLEKAKSQNKWGEEFWSKYKSSDGLSQLGQGIINLDYSSVWKENIGYGEQIQYAYVQDKYEYANWGASGFTKTSEKNGGFLFIKLGKILHILENKITLTTDKNKILNFDYGYEDNLIGIIKSDPSFNSGTTSFLLPNSLVINQMSYNPYKCVTLKNIDANINHPITPAYGNGKVDDFSKVLNQSMTYGTGMMTPNIHFATYYAPLNFAIKILDHPSEDFDVTLKGTDYGRIMNILVNAEFVLDVVDDKTNKETGELPLIDFLKGILAGINESLGGINELDVFIDETVHKVKIIDTNPLPGLNNLLKLKGLQSTSTTFNLYGYNKKGDESNFIHDFNLTTEITPALSTMITVAATSNNTVVGEDNTALSKINKGLSDRYKNTITLDVETPLPYAVGSLVKPSQFSPEYDRQYLRWLHKYGIGYNINGDEDAGFNVISPVTLTYEMFDNRNPSATYPPGIYGIIPTISTLSTTSKKEQLYVAAAYSLDRYNLPAETSFWQILQHLALGYWKQGMFDNFSNSFKDVNRKWNDLIGKGKNNPEFKSGFIPFNLSLTMDGLGGMKIYQKFNVDTDFMPSNYPSSIEFLIKNIQHTVKDNKWITKIESFCVSKPGSNVTPASTPTVSAVGSAHNILITSGYAQTSTSTNVAYQATITDLTSATQNIVITFTDTLKNTSAPHPAPLPVTITILAGATLGTAAYTFTNADILKSSSKTSVIFTDPALAATYQLQIGPDKFISGPPVISTSGWKITNGGNHITDYSQLSFHHSGQRFPGGSEKGREVFEADDTNKSPSIYNNKHGWSREDKNKTKVAGETYQETRDKAGYVGIAGNYVYDMVLTHTDTAKYRAHATTGSRDVAFKASCFIPAPFDGRISQYSGIGESDFNSIIYMNSDHGTSAKFMHGEWYSDPTVNTFGNNAPNVPTNKTGIIRTITKGEYIGIQGNSSPKSWAHHLHVSFSSLDDLRLWIKDLTSNFT